MERLNLSLDIRGRPCLIVGGGEQAARQVDRALRAGARLSVVAPELDESLRQHHGASRFVWHAREFTAADVEGHGLVLAASGCAETDRRVAEAAAAHGALYSDAGAGALPLSAAQAQTANHPATAHRGSVQLVGAGPGDPRLLTVEGQRALEQADIVLHDRLIPQEMLDLAPAHADRVFVGKQRSRHHYRQDELNELMIRLAREGQRVVRLKGGDPFLFGRGGEEAAALAAAGIDCRVIPGVTAGSGCATYAGIPLTHRDHAHACQFITAHDKDGECPHDWAALTRPQQTLVVYMGLLALRSLCPHLIEHGMDPETPAALIEKGTTPEQRVLVGTVSSLPEIAAAHEPESPAVVIIGEVVRLREHLGEAGPPFAYDPPEAG